MLVRSLVFLSGVITLSKQLDYEITPKYELYVAGTTSDNSTSRIAIVRFNVINVNDNNPVIAAIQTKPILELLPAGSEVGDLKECFKGFFPSLLYRFGK